MPSMSSSCHEDRGQSAIEYAALIGVVASIIAVMLYSFPGMIGNRVERTVCQLFQEEECESQTAKSQSVDGPNTSQSTPARVDAWRPDDGPGRARGGRPQTVEQQVERITNMLDLRGEEGEELFMTHVENALDSCASEGWDDDACPITRDLGNDPRPDSIDVDEIDEYQEFVALAALYLWSDSVENNVITEIDHGAWMPTECAPTCMAGQTVGNAVMNGDTSLPIEELIFETLSDAMPSPGGR